MAQRTAILLSMLWLCSTLAYSASESLPQYPIAIIGESYAGKSSLLRQFACGEFFHDERETIAFDFRVRPLKVDGADVTMVIYDTAGTERFDSITDAYFKKAHGFILVFDTTDFKSYQRLAHWQNRILRIKGEDVPVVVIGNKIDLKGQRQVSTDELESYAKKHNFGWTEASAANSSDKGFVTALEYLVRAITKQRQERNILPETRPVKIMCREPDKHVTSNCCGT